MEFFLLQSGKKKLKSLRHHLNSILLFPVQKHKRILRFFLSLPDGMGQLAGAPWDGEKDGRDRCVNNPVE